MDLSRRSSVGCCLANMPRAGDKAGVSVTEPFCAKTGQNGGMETYLDAYIYLLVLI